MGRTKMLLALVVAISFSFVPRVVIAEDFTKDINGLFGIRWGDTRAELSDLFQSKLKRATYSDVAGYQRFSIKRDDSKLRYTVDDVQFLGFHFDVLIFMDEEKVVKVVGYGRGAEYEDYYRLKNGLIVKIGEPKSTRTRTPWFFKSLSHWQKNFWRIGMNAMSITFSDKIFGDTIQIWARGEE